MKNFNAQYLMVLMMAVMVYAASLHSKDDTLEEIREEALELNKTLNQTDLLLMVTKIERYQNDSVDKFLCLAEKALKRNRHRESFKKTDKLIRQLFQYNQKHTNSCVFLNTNASFTLQALLEKIVNC
ncbi:Microtubule cross-linking factor 1 [Dissostichus eleginoides]|uniref:Microtubule cross-linking factor 1 n=1 Tax=Dissostichus eleginoides TaxID=100907 RepID=A0AAD9FJY1_DISEL|nr:Microtubule cross-linking factor 1 [Dissostichus eleginoides]